MTYWIFPWSRKVYDVTGSLLEFDNCIDWRRSCNAVPGDLVFLYCTLPVGRITHLFEVIGTDISNDEAFDDSEYFENKADAEKVSPKGYIRLKLISIAETCEALTFGSLVGAGMNNVRTPVRVRSEQLLRHLLSGFDVEPDKTGEKYVEGSAHTVRQTLYERDPAAREACLRHYGNKFSCEICGINFRERYGEVGKDFIHVHHINFLSANQGQQTLTDPTKDLLPVCPNCHAMLHRKVDGKYLSVDELRYRVTTYLSLPES